MTKKTLVLIDYENFHVRPNRLYDLSITETGLKALTELIESRHGKLQKKNDMITVAYWDDFKKQKDYFSRNFRDVVDVRTKGSNVSDGYLIVRCMEKISEFEEGSEVVIIGNDGVYTGLVNHLLYLGLKVSVYYWGEKVADSLLINEDVQAYSLEDLFEFGSNKHLSNGWFSSIGATPTEYAIISLALRKDDYELMHVSTANKIYQNVTDDRYKEITTFDEAMSFLDLCMNENIFIPGRKDVPGKDVPQKTLTLNTANEKVKYVLANRLKGAS